jgi:PhzF family phenazine biosynthesis protein
MEIDLCGHATLASGFVVYQYLGYKADAVEFDSKSGPLRVLRQGNLLALDFPSRPAQPVETPEALVRGLGRKPERVLKSRDFLAVFEREEDVATLVPDQAALSELDTLGIIVTAPGKKVDFVSRFFAPRAGIPEDPVTGSAHSTLIPYWSQRLGKKRLHALQLSARGGELFCEDLGERVHIGGHAVAYSVGTIEL